MLADRTAISIANSETGQFLFMDGCLNYPYPDTMRQHFQAAGPVGGSPVTPRPDATMVTCFAASVGERALEPSGRGLFLSSLLPQLDPANPCSAYPDALAYSFDQGTRSVDLYRLMDPYITQRVRAATGGAQNPRVFVEGAGESVDGVHPLFRVLPDPETVEVSLTVDPPEATVNVERMSVWIDAPPFPSKYLYRPPPLVVPVHTRVPRGADGIATCNLPPSAPWDVVCARWPFKADADQTVSFALTAMPSKSYAGGMSTWSPPQLFAVKIVNRDGSPYGALSRPEEQIPGGVGYEQVTGMVGLPESPAVTVDLHEDGPEFWVDPEAAEVGAETVAAWAGALRTLLPEGLRVITIVRDGLAPRYEKLRLQLRPGGARRLAGLLAGHAAVVIERGPVARPPAWRLALTPEWEWPIGVEKVLSLAELEQRPGVAVEPGPVRISVELPWGSWTTVARVPASGIEQIELPTTVGVAPLRVAFADDLPYLAKRHRFEQPMILGLQGDPPEATLVGLLERVGMDAEVVASPSASAAWAIAQPGRGSVLRLEGPQATLFPLAGRSLAVDLADGVPRVEPLSTTKAPEWDLLFGTGRLETLEAEVAWNLAREADDRLLRLAGAYVLYARRDWKALGEALPFGKRPRQLDEALLWLAAIHRGDGSSTSEDVAMNKVSSAAKAGQVPLLRWGMDLALTVLTVEALRRSSTIATWHAALAAIRPRLSPRSVWTAWTESWP